MATWLIITGSGLDDWIYLRLLCKVSLNHNQLPELTIIGFIDAFFVQSLLITINYQNSLSIFSLTLLPWLPRACPIHLLVLRRLSNWITLTLISSRHRPHTENTALLLLRECPLGFPCDLYPTSPLALWLVLNNGLGANHIEHTATVLLAACLFERVYLATGVSGSVA
jgi:hypothetical protein